jgi:thymidylate kinase
MWRGSHCIIHVEGLDGSGKTTLVPQLAQALLSELGHFAPAPEVCTFRQPSLARRGGIVAAASWQEREALFLHDQVRSWVDEIQPALRTSHVVLDRGLASGYAYWGGRDEATCLSALHMAAALTASPDAIVWVDTPPAVCLERIRSRSGDDALDPASLRDLHRIRGRYQALFAALTTTTSQRPPQPFWRPRPPRQYPSTPWGLNGPQTASQRLSGAFAPHGPRPVIISASGEAPDVAAEARRVAGLLRPLLVG